MPQLVKFSRSRGRLGSPRQTSWFPIDLTSTTVSGAGSLLNSLTTAELARRPFTIIRTHLEMQIVTDQSANSEFQLAGLGMCVVSDQAAAIGVTAVPTPLTDLDSDLWFVHQLLFCNQQIISAIGFTNPSGVRMAIDSKAARKVNDAENVVVTAQQNSILGDGFSMQVGGRLLIKEH